MGFSRKRLGKDGKPRYTAYYQDLQGRERSAGTYPNRRDADRAWQQAEVKLAEGRLGDPRRGRQSFQRYVEDEWLPHHVMEATTREGYTYQIRRHIMPWFGPMRMSDILPSHVREWIAHLQQGGASPWTVANVRRILSAIFTTAVNDQVTFLHPCRGVRTPPVPTVPRRIITPEQFDRIYEALPDADSRLLVEAKLETGLRWGELTELRRADIDPYTRVLTVSRAVVQLGPKFHPEGGRFLVKKYPKDREYRRLKLSPHINDRLAAHIATHGIRASDLLFSFPHEDAHHRGRTTTAQGADLGLTEPNAAGRRYRHGTLTAYTAGSCRCQHCRDAYATYRARRRAAGLDSPRQPRTAPTDDEGHVPRDWFRNNIWTPALRAADLPFHVRIHDLRHAHASWLLAGGADLQVVKERLGHASIVTTEKYLHTLPDADETAITAFTTIRHRARS